MGNVHYLQDKPEVPPAPNDLWEKKPVPYSKLWYLFDGKREREGERERERGRDGERKRERERRGGREKGGWREGAAQHFLLRVMLNNYTSKEMIAFVICMV